MQSRRSLLATFAAGATTVLAGCSNSSSIDSTQAETDVTTTSGIDTDTSTPTGPQPGSFKSGTFSNPRNFAGSEFAAGGRYSDDFQNPEELTEVFSHELKDTAISSSGIYITDATTFIVDENNVRRVEYDGSTTWEAGSNLDAYGPIVDGKTVIISTRDRIIGYDRSTGDQNWVREGGTPISAENGYLYTRSDNSIIKSNIDDGSSIWEITPKETRGEGLNESSYRLDTVEALTSNYIIVSLDHLEEGLIAAYHRDSGNRVWITEEPIKPYFSLIIQGDNIIACSYTSLPGEEPIFEMFIYSLSDGTKQLSFKHDSVGFRTSNTFSMGFATSNGDQVFVTGEKEIRSYNMDDGSIAWETLLASQPTPAIACSNETVYSVLNDDIVTYDAADGSEIGQYSVSLSDSAGVSDSAGISIVGDHIIHTQDIPSGTTRIVKGYAPPE
ncbi:PQQ-like domain-containing protein [Haloarcula vallismortis]|uniref:PQQ-like domain-containing protein n=1 Tax=Haloarcula vallismortis TaxID=28442 RepID=A0A1H3AJM8_HALVA|nr:PQQ-binding-like beta-propeller repeat protein [Haloarcula vallismortis]SDX29364.1 PQQ-like domain-containing protein [Haloarcula vallismortis]